jgi:N6-L-threonylcarbamoyladenine synthase
MKILAIDTSCDESCASVLDTDSWTLLSDVVHSHVGQMTRWGGIVPEIASREHLKALPLAVQESLDRAKLSLKDIDWFAVTNRPGLIGALLVGVSYTKGLAYSLEKPFSVMNHIEAHLYSPLLATLEKDLTQPPPFPWIALVVSGGHTELFHVKGVQDYKWLGGTLDDAAGEAFDKIGKLLGLSYPQGPAIDRMVRDSRHELKSSRFHFPRAKTESFAFSYSGLKTAVAQAIQKHGALSDEEKIEVAAEGQEAILDPLVDKMREAAKFFDVKNLVVAGGVACNSRLRAKLPDAFFPKPKHCTDNAAMIACLAGLHHREKKLAKAEWSVTAEPSLE